MTVYLVHVSIETGIEGNFISVVEGVYSIRALAERREKELSKKGVTFAECEIRHVWITSEPVIS